MKKKALLFGVLPVLALASGIFLSSSDYSEGKYEQRLSSHFDAASSGIDGAYEYYRLIKGDFTDEDWRRSNAIANSVSQDRSTFSWVDQGPDNIGGRTRAIVIDRANKSHLYAGSVSGGLFESWNGANTWQQVTEFDQNYSVSSMCQTLDGTFYVATGHGIERNSGTQNAYDTGARGYGVYRSETDGSWTLLEGTEEFNYINEVVCDDINNKVWIAGDKGLKTYSIGAGLEDSEPFPASVCNALSISKDGTVLIGYGGSKVYTSVNSGSSFVQVSDTGEDPGVINTISVGRIEFAISHEKVDGAYRVYASAASSLLEGIWRSADNGITWERIAPANDGAPGGFAPFTAGGSNGQGTYDNIITVVPGAPDRIYLGGIDCYTWTYGGNWEQVSQWFLSPTSPNYVHADNHEFQWDVDGRLYIGNDGGISFCDNAAGDDPSFHHANRGYNVTQFFATGVSAHGDVIGGAQDNGTKANYHTGSTLQEHMNIGGGDGFSCAISFINRNLTFGSVYYSSVYRSSGRGASPSVFFPIEYLDGDPCSVGSTEPGEGCGQFFTNFEMWEHPNDLASSDTLRYIASEAFLTGDNISVPSATSQTFIDYTCPIDIVFDDTLFFDPAYTYPDTVIVDEISGSFYNLGILEWEYIYGASEISIGDSILLFGEEDNDTLIVESFEETNHYVGTHPDKPGQFIDMGDNERLLDIAWDTLRVQDPYQSWFALDMGNTNGVYMTRNALRFSAEMDWFKIGEDLGNIASMEFTKDGNALFLGTFDGRLYRYTGFNSAYSPTGMVQDSMVGGITYGTLTDSKGDPHVTELELIKDFGSASITGIASGPIGDPNYLVITQGGYIASGRVQECTNALGDDPDFSVLGFPGTGSTESGIPCYAVVVDREDPNIIVVGTEFGVYATENGGNTASDWTNVSGVFGNVPVYDMQQNWRTWVEGCKRPGEIYIGTHGRGIWSTDVFLNTPDENNDGDKDKFNSNLKLYPNPLRESGTVAFNLAVKEDVTLQIFNLNGQVVSEVLSKDLQAGSNQIAFNTDNLPQGTYVLRLNSNSMSETTKFIKR